MSGCLAAARAMSRVPPVEGEVGSSLCGTRPLICRGNRQDGHVGKKRNSKGGSAISAIVFCASIGLFVSIIGLIGVGPSFARDTSVRSHGVHTVGVITEVVHYTTHSRHSTSQHYYPIVLTMVGGHAYETKTKAYNVASSTRFHRGEEVPVIYDSRDASRVVADWPGAHDDLASRFWFIAVLGLTSLVVGAVAVIFAHVKKRRRRKG